MNEQLIKELEKEVEVIEYALELLNRDPKFHEEFEGTSICYSPVKLMEKHLANVSSQLVAAKANKKSYE